MRLNQRLERLETAAAPHLHAAELRAALDRLPADQRADALRHIEQEGLTGADAVAAVELFTLPDEDLMAIITGRALRNPAFVDALQKVYGD